MKTFLHIPAAILVLLLSACTTVPSTVSATPAPVSLTVFAAASLRDAFSELGGNYTALHPNVRIQFNFAGSQTLRTQIEQGASVDVFASADLSNMSALQSEKLVQASQIFTRNQLVVILPPNNPAAVSTLQDLAKPGLKLVLAANTVPAGKYALQSLDLMNSEYGQNFKTRVLANVVSNEQDVKAVVAKVSLGEADAGIVYVSDATAVPTLKSIPIPTSLNVMAEYPIAALVNSNHLQTADEFISYVLSAEGQAVLEKWGFTPLP